MSSRKPGNNYKEEQKISAGYVLVGIAVPTFAEAATA
jgi:hypothetical protein